MFQNYFQSSDVFQECFFEHILETCIVMNWQADVVLTPTLTYVAPMHCNTNWSRTKINIFNYLYVWDKLSKCVNCYFAAFGWNKILYFELNSSLRIILKSFQKLVTYIKNIAQIKIKTYPAIGLFTQSVTQHPSDDSGIRRHNWHDKNFPFGKTNETKLRLLLHHK